ncbi:MAG: hypothetical protein M0Z60_03055 [Nitrospiraceae bacterium]|nr:hypothetical protein [Nitrospiraceae bacterium]
MKGQIYPALKEKATRVARQIGAPSFYRDHGSEIERSAASLAGNELFAKCRSLLGSATLHPAHGIEHCEKVAVEAGAILRIERGRRHPGVADTDGLVLCAQIAGILHDIKRNEHNHTTKGSIEAEKILGGFDLKERYKRYVAAAIRNHEAFREVLPSEDEEAKLVSDSLYDADKFRWGPDNFTTTLWLIVESAGTPVERLHATFLEKMEGVRRIKETFRTDTGRRYGPEFIDFGIEIGNEIFHDMENLIRSRK